MPPIVSLHEAKAKLSALIDRAAAGEEVVIARDGVPRAKLVPIRFAGKPREPAGAIRVHHIAPDFDAPDAAIEDLLAGDGCV